MHAHLTGQISFRDQPTRIAWIDIAKSLGIIAVVIGHAYPIKDTFYKTTYWWHMPLFFLVGGFFIRALRGDHRQVMPFLRSKIWPLLRDYLIAGGLIITLNYFAERRNPTYTLAYFGRLLYGGTKLNGYTSAFWFMTVYILALLLTTLIVTYVRYRWAQALLVTGLFLVGTSYESAQAVFGFALPWNADVALMAVFYMWVGHYSFPYLRRLVAQRWFLGLSLGLSVCFVTLQGLAVIDQVIYMKSHQITNGWFAMVTPIILCFAVLAIAYWLQFTWLRGLLCTLGQCQGRF